MIQRCPLLRHAAATNQCGLQPSAKLVMLAATISLTTMLAAFADWWPLWLWVGASVATSVLVTPPWDRRFGRVVEEFTPVRGAWATYLVLGALWTIVLALLFQTWGGR